MDEIRAPETYDAQPPSGSGGGPRHAPVDSSAFIHDASGEKKSVRLRPGTRGLGRGELGAPELDAAKLLLQWRTAEIAAAQRRFRRLSIEDLEEVYDETVDALLKRRHESELHLVRALTIGIRMRALNKLRDRKTHERLVDEAAPAFYEEGQSRMWEADPERALLAREDEVIVGEFIAELTPEERQAFVLTAEGRSWRAAGTALGIAHTEARKLTRRVEQKRERFVKLFQSGRLCGYRSHTIDSLLSGEESGRWPSVKRWLICGTATTARALTKRPIRIYVPGSVMMHWRCCRPPWRTGTANGSIVSGEWLIAL